MSQLYGEKCIRCAHIRHDGTEGLERDEPWLANRGVTCARCVFCQSDALLRVLPEAGLDFFDPEVRAAVAAFRDGKDHPLIDRLRAECNALGQVIEWNGERWSVADAKYDTSDEMDTGDHWHLTLTRAGGGLSHDR